MKNTLYLLTAFVGGVLSGCAYLPEEEGNLNEGFFLEEAGMADSGYAPSPSGGYMLLGDDCNPCVPPCPPPCEECGPCYFLCEGYEPSYRTVAKCVEDKIPCKRQACRYVDKYYEVPRCRFVPEYYTETVCKTELEYFEVDDCITKKRWVYDQECTFVPKYYWKDACECGPTEP
jgi:hypothetical protein